MRISILQEGLPFIFYISFLSICTAMLSSVLGPLGFVLFIFTIIALLIIIYLFREIKNEKIMIGSNNILFPCNGMIQEINYGLGPLSKDGIEIKIHRSIFDSYTYYSPMEGIITKIIILNTNNRPHILIEIKSNSLNNETVILCIYPRARNTNIDKSFFRSYVTKEEKVYLQQPLCIALFGSQCTLFIPQTLSISHFHAGRYVTSGELCIAKDILAVQNINQSSEK